MDNTNTLLMNIIKNSEDIFIDKDVLLNIHFRINSLDSNKKLRKAFEYKYNNLRIKELEEEIDELKFQRKFYLQRNNNILKTIQNNNFKSFDLHSKTNDIIQNINETKNKYQQYLNNNSNIIKKEFIEGLLLNKNILIKEKEKEIEKQKKIEHEYDYYDELGEINEKIVKDIQKLRKINKELNDNNENKKLKFLQREKYLKEMLNIGEEKEKLVEV